VSRALRRLIRQMFPDGRCAKAVAFRRDYRMLDKQLGPFDEAMLPHAAGVVIFQHAFQDATREVQRMQEARAHGRGRRPTAAAIERLKRRQGLSWQSFDQARRRLEELAASNPKRGSLADLLSEPGAREVEP
jgi:hypothetical protein